MRWTTGPTRPDDVPATVRLVDRDRRVGVTATGPAIGGTDPEAFAPQPTQFSRW